MANKSDSHRPTKLEKTGDHTFNVHTENGGHFECESKKDLSKFSKMKNINHAGSGILMIHGIGEKTGLICDSCRQVVSAVTGKYSDKLKEIFYICGDCNFDDFVKKILASKKEETSHE